ncbi:MAG: glycosyltransferase family 2 protein [Polyangiaceae bacterium]
MNAPHPTFALVLETNNLRGGDAEDTARVTKSLTRLFEHLRRQTHPLASLAEVVLTHDGLPEPARADLARSLGRPVRFVEIAPETGYYEAKNRGFDATTADVVAFADADCIPAPEWLSSLLAPFARPEVQVTAGRTTYRDDVLGAAATTIDFMYFPSPLAEGATRNFYANNVAFRRDIFARFRYESAPGIYRGHCQRLGLALARADIPVLHVPEAHTVHRFPDSARELVRLRLLRGADTVEMAPSLANAHLPERLRWLGRTGPLAALAVLGARFAFSQRALGRQGLSRLRPTKRAAARAAIAGISALDTAGALGRSILRRDLGVRDGALVRDALSYHRDGDRV